jgi:hypothetical protein
MPNNNSLTLFIKSTFIGLLALFILNGMVGEASPLYRRQENQIPVPDTDIREFKLWVKYAR